LDKKKTGNKKARKKKVVTNKKQYHLITDIRNECRASTVVSFDSKEEVQDYLVTELEGQANYDFTDGDDIIIYGELQKVSVTEKTYKVNVK
jgi:hypothetical protein